MFAVAIAEVNMGRATAGANQIYCVIHPERNAAERERSGSRLKGASFAKQIITLILGLFEVFCWWT